MKYLKKENKIEMSKIVKQQQKLVDDVLTAVLGEPDLKKREKLKREIKKYNDMLSQTHVGFEALCICGKIAALEEKLNGKKKQTKKEKESEKEWCENFCSMASGY